MCVCVIVCYVNNMYNIVCSSVVDTPTQIAGQKQLWGSIRGGSSAGGNMRGGDIKIREFLV
jgi:hypothetical protein